MELSPFKIIFQVGRRPVRAGVRFYDGLQAATADATVWLKEEYGNHFKVLSVRPATDLGNDPEKP